MKSSKITAFKTTLTVEQARALRELCGSHLEWMPAIIRSLSRFVQTNDEFPLPLADTLASDCSRLANSIQSAVDVFATVDSDKRELLDVNSWT